MHCCLLLSFYIIGKCCAIPVRSALFMVIVMPHLMSSRDIQLCFEGSIPFAYAVFGLTYAVFVSVGP